MKNRFIFPSFFKKYFLPIILFLSFKLFASTDPILEYSKNSQWIRNLHYKQNFHHLRHGTEISGFYLTKIADPYLELKANLDEAESNVFYQCLFPYRAKLLVRAGLWKPRSITCTAYTNWKNVFDKDQVSIAFASQYMSNPASVFGHTFLVFSPDRSVSSPHPEYLDITIGYAAEMPEHTGAMKYITSGLGGGFKGRFFDEPFYKRIHEYSNMELRDLWVYPIKMTPEQIDDLLDHIYELTIKDYFSYYFLDENCSFMALQLLEVIFPKMNLVSDFPLYVIPSETIKTLDRRGMLKKGVLIPSMRTKFLKEFELLTKNEKKEVKLALKSNIDELKNKDSVDTFITYMDKRKIETKGIISLDDQRIFQELLIKRSKMGPKVDKEVTYPSLDPIKSHHPYAAIFKSGARNGDAFQELEFRLTVHELLDLGHGQIKHSQIKLLTPTLRLNNDGGVRLQKFQFFNLANLVPYNSLDPIYSWQMALERDHTFDQLCFDCSVTRFNLGIGYDFSLKSWLDYYLLPGLQTEWGKDLVHHYRGGLGGNTGFILNFSEKIKFNQSISYYYADDLAKFRKSLLKIGLEGSYNHSQSLSIRAAFHEIHTAPTTKNSNEVSTSLVYFF